MVLYDVRCRDVARILDVGPKTRREIGAELARIHPTLRGRGSWIREVLLEQNPLVVRVSEDTWDLSDMGRALVKLPGGLGEPLTPEETAFLLGLLLSDPKQRRVAAELLASGSSTGEKWVVVQTARVLEKLGVFRRAPRTEEAVTAGSGH